MGRLHKRNGILILKDAAGRVLEVPVLDWVLEYDSQYPQVTVLRVTVAEVP